MTKLSQKLKRLVLIVPIAVIGYGYYQVTKPQPVVFQGQLEAQETNVSSKISGRIDEIFVEEGQNISVGTPIYRMDSPEIEAKVAQAKAARDAANAIMKKAQAGARKQQVQIAYDQMSRAKAAFVAHEKTWQRISQLVKEGLISQQKADEVQAEYISAQEQYKAAQSQYSLAKEGARPEDIRAAQAQARQGQAVVAEAMVAKQETQLVSPIAGEVSQVVFHKGELVVKGVPVVTIVDLSKQRLEFNVRETHIKNFALKSEFTADIPALDLTDVPFKVYSSSILPAFATWRPTRSDAGFDVRTFVVKARPLEPIKGMRPGMSALINLPE